MLKEHASVMIKPLRGNLVKIMVKRKCANCVDFQNWCEDISSGNLMFRALCWGIAEL